MLTVYCHLDDEARRFVGHVHDRLVIVFGVGFSKVAVTIVERMSTKPTIVMSSFQCIELLTLMNIDGNPVRNKERTDTITTLIS